MQVFDFAYVDSQEAIPNRLALLDLVFHPSARARFLTHKDNGDGRSFELIVDPVLNGYIALSFQFLEISRIYESCCFPALRDPAIANHHCPRHVFVLEAKEYSSRHEQSPLVLVRLLSIQPFRELAVDIARFVYPENLLGLSLYRLLGDVGIDSQVLLPLEDTCSCVRQRKDC